LEPPARPRRVGDAIESGQVESLRVARRVLDDVVGEIRGVPGFEDFLAQPTFATVAQAAARTPVIYLAPAEVAGLGLVVRGERVDPVDLPELTAEAVRGRVHDCFHAYQAFRRSRDRSSRAAWRVALDEVTRWLWEVAVGPVLDVATGASELVLVPCGRLGLLPLHAAWKPAPDAPSGRHYLIDEAAITYAANARAYATCAARAREAVGRRLLVVADPGPEAGVPLPDTRAEAGAARAAFADAVVLAGEDAVLDDVAREMTTAGVLHLGCHGAAVLNDPLRSHLLLAGGARLELDRILRMRLQARLVVLSACETSLPGIVLPDEVVSLPTGLVQAGAAGVLATMWITGDRDPAIHMVEFYRRWAGGGSPSAALAATQRWLRDITLGEFERAWEEALDTRQSWLPTAFGEQVLNAVLEHPEGPGARPWSGIDTWAAFALTGA
jgi:CHAT domain-containing protein